MKIKSILILIVTLAFVLLNACANYQSAVKADEKTVIITGFTDYLIIKIPRVYTCNIDGKTLNCRVANVQAGAGSLN